MTKVFCEIMEKQIRVLFVFIFVQEAVCSLHTEIEVQIPVAEGRDTSLTCQFDMPDSKLYSVKWYKDDVEFYRYRPKSGTPFRTYRWKGVNVDVSRSSQREVTLSSVSQNTAGLYRCEVIGEGPDFPISFADKYIEVHLVPEAGPYIVGAKDVYHIGDIVDVNCTSQPSRPMTHLSWWIHDEVAPTSSLIGPSLRYDENSVATITTLRLIFTLVPGKYPYPEFVIMCLANIDSYYRSKTVHRIQVEVEPPKSLFDDVQEFGYSEASYDPEETNETGPGGSSSISGSVSLIIFASFSQLLKAFQI